MKLAKYLTILLVIVSTGLTANIDPRLQMKLNAYSNSRSAKPLSLIALHKDSSVSIIRGEDALEKAMTDTSVLTIYSDKKLEPTLDSAREQIHCAPVHAGTNFKSAYKGKGVLVGIIDGGFDYTNPAFRKPDGSSRILQVWDQADSTGSSKPSKFTYGSEAIGSDAILAKLHDRRMSSHGTLVGATAAGSQIDNLPNYGIAPEADLIFVGTNYESSGVMDAVEYILSAAESMKRPVVINMSFASPNGSHDGTSVEDRFMEQNSHRGILVTAASNSGHVNQHIQFDLNGKDTLRTFATMPNQEGYLDFWGTKSQNFSIIPTLTNHDGTELIKLPAINLTTTRYDTTIGVGQDSVKIQAEATTQADQNGKPMITIALTPKSGHPDWVFDFSIAITGTSGTVHGWNGMYRDYSDRGKAGYIKGNTSMTIGDGPGTSKGTITVGSWCSRRTYTNWYDSTVIESQPYDLGRISFFSSRGPTIDGRDKPDVTAPGQEIESPFNSYDTTILSRRIVYKHLYNDRIYPYSVDKGTSFASPVVVGAIALMMEVAPTLTRQEILSIFRLTSRHDSATTEQYRWGYGKLDIEAAMHYVESNSSAIISTQSFTNGLKLVRSGNALRIVDAKGINQTITLSIFSLTGKLICEKKITNNENVIELHSLATGIYLYKLTAGETTSSGKIFIPN